MDERGRDTLGNATSAHESAGTGAVPEPAARISFHALVPACRMSGKPVRVSSAVPGLHTALEARSLLTKWEMLP